MHCSESDSIIKRDLVRNRSIAKLFLRRYKQAFIDAIASFVKSDSPDNKAVAGNVKVRYRAGCSAYHLSNFTEAQVQFNRVLEIDQADGPAI